MKKYILLLAAAVCAVSCYDDYVKDYSKVACGFANQTDVRSVVVGEGMSFSTGIALGGVIDNTKDRKITVGVDYSMVNEDTYNLLKGHSFSYIADLMKEVPSISALPFSDYALETETSNPGVVLIRKGSHLGLIKVKVDSVKFLSDPGRVYPKDVVSLRITDAGETGVMEGKDYTVIGVRYENMLFGTWYHGGRAEIKDGSGTVTGKKEYFTTIPQADNLVWTLKTVEPFALTANAVGNGFNGSKAQMKLTLGKDDSIVISSVSGADFEVQPDGESRFVRSRLLQDRKIVLAYKYVDGGNTIHARDTLTFRNRIRDGVNEWQDENSAHYE